MIEERKMGRDGGEGIVEYLCYRRSLLCRIFSVVFWVRGCDYFGIFGGDEIFLRHYHGLTETEQPQPFFLECASGGRRK